eukprot:TRINITY_DN13030_c0_g1_i1.p1 TRINITY_DN13030_c0_g1~~TRINITY_DN13030_c0_g1_i1.p1  ORF type:complete len:159 (+),score=2.20 TRINITY_DN13030_c0_g1_i1:99-575(+)
MLKWSKKNNINIHSVAPGNHKSNGICERAIQSIKNKMKKIQIEKNYKFQTLLKVTTMAYNESYNRSIGCSPNFKATRKRITDVKLRKWIDDEEHVELSLPNQYWRNGDTVAFKNLGRSQFTHTRWLGPATIISSNGFSNYWLMWNGKKIKRTIEHIKD